MLLSLRIACIPFDAASYRGHLEFSWPSSWLISAVEASKEALSDMPPRSEDELDPVTLHNQALMHMDTDPTAVRPPWFRLVWLASCSNLLAPASHSRRRCQLSSMHLRARSHWCDVLACIDCHRAGLPQAELPADDAAVPGRDVRCVPLSGSTFDALTLDWTFAASISSNSIISRPYPRFVDARVQAICCCCTASTSTLISRPTCSRRTPTCTRSASARCVHPSSCPIRA